jgi:predicted metal-dependent peptidase
VEKNAKLKKRIALFEDEFDYWMGALRLGYAELLPDKNLPEDVICKVCLYKWVDEDKFFPVICYNEKELLECNISDLIQTVLHEIGHIFYGHIYEDENENKSQFEYEAEKFALKIIKAQYKELYLDALDNLVRISQIEDSIYSKVALRILKEEAIEGDMYDK